MTIRPAIEALSGARLVLRDDEYFKPKELSATRGGSWLIEPGPGTLSLGSPLIMSLRGATHPGNVRTQFVLDGTLRLNDRTDINICVSHWVEQIADPKPAPFLKGMALPIALRSHVAIEEIGHGNDHQAPADLGREELEAVASFIKPAVSQILAADVAILRKQGLTGRPVPATGALEENWRKPRAEFAELHEHLDRFRRGSLAERINDPELDRYSFIQEEKSLRGVVEGSRMSAWRCLGRTWKIPPTASARWRSAASDARSTSTTSAFARSSSRSRTATGRW